ncbi:hypothetical protein ACF0H5_011461 [Mactra antiquata]
MGIMTIITSNMIMFTTVCCIFVFFWNISSATKYHLVTMPFSWSNAVGMCKASSNMLLPDVSNDIENHSSLYEMLPVNEFIWVDAVSFAFNYKTKYEHLKLSYKPMTSKVQNYLCKHVQGQTVTRKSSSRSITWSTARSKCEKDNTELLNLPYKGSIRYVVSILMYDEDSWIDIVGWYPPELKENNTSCLGITKTSDGSVNLVADVCSNKHQYICVNGEEGIVPTLTRLRSPVSQYMYNQSIQPTKQPVIITTEGINNSFVEEVLTSSNSISEPTGPSLESGTGGMSTVATAGMIVGIILLLLVGLGAFCIIYYRKRWLRRQAYQKSLHNYTRRRGDTGTFSNDTLRSTDDVDQAGEEKYEQCQKDVVDACYKRKNDRYISKPTPCSGYTSSQGYHVMSGNNQVVSYEGYDPDIGHLQRVHGYINQPITDQQHGIQVVSYTSKLPNKVNKKVNIPLVDSGQYEDPLKPSSNTVRLDDLDQYENEELGKPSQVSNAHEQPSNSLDDLDQYENYQVPDRRKKGAMATQSPVTKTRSGSVRSSKRSQSFRKNGNYTVAKPINELDKLDSYENYQSPKLKAKNLEQAYIDEENYYDT